jgi:hypothetical protein
VVGTSSRLANLRGPPAIDSSNFAIVIWFRPPATSLKDVAPSVLKVDHQRIRASSLNINRNVQVQADTGKMRGSLAGLDLLVLLLRMLLDVTYHVLPGAEPVHPVLIGNCDFESIFEVHD